MILRDILQSKGRAVHTIGPQATLEDVVQTLVRNNCGSLVVCDGPTRDGDRSAGRLLGIITERDILKACATHRAEFARLTARDAISATVITGSPGDSVEDTMGLMTEKRIRHLPIIENGELQGLVSIGDVVKLQHDSLTLENHYLKNYLQG